MKMPVIPAAVLAALLLTIAPARADENNGVLLPLADYLALQEQATRLEKAAAEAARAKEQPFGEVVEQRTFLTWGDEEVQTRFELDVLVRGETGNKVDLPLLPMLAATRLEQLDAAGRATPADARAALGQVPGRGVALLPSGAGTFRVYAEGRVPLGKGGGSSWLALPQVAAAVASTDIVLPAELEWSCPGAVVVGDLVKDGKRELRLATRRGQSPILQTRRAFAGAERDKVLAHTLVLTLLQLNPDGPRRHDVVYYQVERGQLGSFTVELPPGLEVDQAATDEGPIVPWLDNGKLRVERGKLLQGEGYLVLSSTPVLEGGRFDWTPPKAEFETRAAFLATATAVAATANPEPAAAFQQVDLDDLPATLRDALRASDLAAAWRATGDATGRRLAVLALPAADLLPVTVARRDTTTLMTVDGTLVYREIFRLPASAKPLAAFEVALPAGAVFWSARLDGEPIRPLEKNGALFVPLALRSGLDAEIEVVSVAEKAIAPGRTRLEIALPKVAAPVLEHHWRLLLPENRRYRFERGDLRPTQAPFHLRGGRSGGAAKIVNSNVAVDQVLFDAPAPAYEPEAAAREDADQELDSLQKGLVGGLKPLPITIPEAGKSLYLTGVLPPAAISVALEVKAR